MEVPNLHIYIYIKYLNNVNRVLHLFKEIQGTVSTDQLFNDRIVFPVIKRYCECNTLMHKPEETC